MEKKSYNYFYRNGLVIAFLTLTILSLAGQIYTGHKEYNEHLAEYGQQEAPLGTYLTSGHFLQSTFENWESEFFQIALFVILTIFLRQQGSSESKSCDDKIIDPDHLKPKADSPWPVKKGGIWLAVYKHSLSIVLLLLFFISFFIHWYGSWKDYNEEQLLQGQETVEMSAYISHTKFWFESFQNWQSEFLSIFAIIFLSIYLRQIGSSQSKPVNASHEKTGE